MKKFWQPATKQLRFFNAGAEQRLNEFIFSRWPDFIFSNFNDFTFVKKIFLILLISKDGYIKW